MKFRKILMAGLMVFALTITNVSAAEVDVQNNDGYQVSDSQKKITPVSIHAEDEKICENEYLELYLQESKMSLKIKDKKTGYVWSSVLEDEDETLNKTWYGFTSSGVSIEAMDSKGKSAKFSVSNGRPRINVTKFDNGFKAKINFKKQGISFDVNVSLKDDQVIVEIPQNSLKETGEEYRLQAIYLFPMMGYTKQQDISGYMFVPDGSGALIRLNNKNTLSTLGYQARIYGQDYGASGTADSVYATSQLQQVHIPVFGMVHNEHQNGFVAVIEDGEEYAEIMATPAGVTTNYNWISARYIVRDSYFRYINKKGDGYVTVQEEPNKFDIKVHYQFLHNEEADYVGMAKHYQQYLVDQKILNKQEKKNEIPFHMEMLMSERKSFLFWTYPVVMTTIDDVKNIVEDLNQKGISNLDITLRGYGKKGNEKQTMSHTAWEKKIGSVNEMKQLIEFLHEHDSRLSLYTDYMQYYDAKGFRPGKDAALSLSEQLLQFRYHEELYVAPTTVQGYYQNEQETFKDWGLDSLSIQSLGSLLYANFNKKNTTTRSEAMDIYQNMIQNDLQANLYETNAYLWKQSGAIYQIPMDSSNYFLFTDKVPFLQIVLKGYKDYYASELNFISGSKEELLRMVDYGAYPSYLITKKDSKELMNTDSSWIYTSSYDSLQENIKEQFDFIHEGLLASEGKCIVSREVIANNVVEVTYDDGTCITINYNHEAYQDIQPLSYIVKKGVKE